MRDPGSGLPGPKVAPIHDAYIMKNAGKVIIVRGHGIAVAQAQHAGRGLLPLAWAPSLPTLRGSGKWSQLPDKRPP